MKVPSYFYAIMLLFVISLLVILLTDNTKVNYEKTIFVAKDTHGKNIVIYSEKDSMALAKIVSKDSIGYTSCSCNGLNILDTVGLADGHAKVVSVVYNK